MYCDANDGWTQEGKFRHQMIQNCVFRFTLANLSDFSQAATLILRPYQGGHFIIVRILRINKELVLQDLFYDSWVSNLSCFRLFSVVFGDDLIFRFIVPYETIVGGEGHLDFATGPYMDFIEFRWVHSFEVRWLPLFPRYIFILLFSYSLFLKDSFISRSTYSQRTEAILDRCLLKESFFS